MANRQTILSKLTPQDINRFWSLVQQDSPDKCWPWRGYVLKKGYGGFSVRHNGKSYQLTSSRIAYALHNNVEPGDLDVLHSCDNPPCCNPACLFLGTNQDNIQDRVSKGRSASGDKHWSRRNPEKTSKGEKHGRAKLQDAQVIEILRRYQDKTARKVLAAEYNVSVGTIDLIVTGRKWKHLQSESIRS